MPKYNNPRKTWQYTNEFKIKAIQLSLQSVVSVKPVPVKPESLQITSLPIND